MHLRAGSNKAYGYMQCCDSCGRTKRSSSFAQLPGEIRSFEYSGFTMEEWLILSKSRENLANIFDFIIAILS